MRMYVLVNAYALAYVLRPDLCPLCYLTQSVTRSSRLLPGSDQEAVEVSLGKLGVEFLDVFERHPLDVNVLCIQGYRLLVLIVLRREDALDGGRRVALWPAVEARARLGRSALGANQLSTDDLDAHLYQLSGNLGKVLAVAKGEEAATAFQLHRAVEAVQVGLAVLVEVIHEVSPHDYATCPDPLASDCGGHLGRVGVQLVG